MSALEGPASEAKIAAGAALAERIASLAAPPTSSGAQSLFRSLVEALGWRLVGELVLSVYRHGLLEGEASLAFREEVSLATGEVEVRGDPVYVPRWLEAELNKKVAEGSAPPKPLYESLLEGLVEAGVLQRRVVSRAAVCPKCRSAKLMLRLYCPNCGSDAVKPTRLVQHVLCGFTDAEDRYERADAGLLRCPRCKAVVSDQAAQLRLLGRIFFCENCKSTFKMPEVKLRCMNKETLEHGPDYEFGLLSVASKELRGYRLAPQAYDKLDELLTEVLRKIVEEKGVRVELYRGRAALLAAAAAVPRELVASGVSAVLELSNGQYLVFDVARGKDVVPYLMKSATVEGSRNVHYLLLASPELELEESFASFKGASKLEGANVTVVSAVDARALEKIAAKVDELLRR